MSSISNKLRTGMACAVAVLFALTALLPLTADAACSKKWKTWHDAVRGKYGILRVDYQICSREEQNFKVYRNEDWDGNKNTFKKIDSFTITPSKPSHSKTHPKYYNSMKGPIEVYYSVKADYKKGNVRSKGHVIYPKLNTPLMENEKKTWDQVFYDIPAPGNVIYTPSDKDRDFVETADIWHATCSDLACGPWVRFRDYSEAHRYNANIPGVGPVIVQLWKGVCPRFNNIDVNGSLRKFLNIGNDFPGGIGAEVGIYVPPGGSKRMIDAAYADNPPPLGKGKWFPLVNSNIKISFRLINPKNGKVLVDAPEKQSWWRTKWMTPEKYAEYKKSNPVPDNPLDYVLEYTINGVKQPTWGYGGLEGRVTGVGRYPELGFNGIWNKDEKLAYALKELDFGNWADFQVFEIYDKGKSVEVTLWKQALANDTKPLDIPLDGTEVKSDDKIRGPYTVSATRPKPNEQGEPRLILDYKYEKAAVLNRTYELILKPNGDIHILNTPVIFYPL